MIGQCALPAGASNPGVMSLDSLVTVSLLFHRAGMEIFKKCTNVFLFPVGCRAAKVGLGDERRLRPLWQPGGQRRSGQHLHGVQHQGCQPEDPQGAGRAHR